MDSRHHFTGGTIDARFLVEDAKIRSVKIYGDFFGTADVAGVEEALKGQAYQPAAIKQVLKALDLGSYFIGIPAAAVIELLAQQHLS